jgi:hypothetical protein
MCALIVCESLGGEIFDDYFNRLAGGKAADLPPIANPPAVSVATDNQRISHINWIVATVNQLDCFGCPFTDLLACAFHVCAPLVWSKLWIQAGKGDAFTTVKDDAH